MYGALRLNGGRWPAGRPSWTTRDGDVSVGWPWGRATRRLSQRRGLQCPYDAHRPAARGLPASIQPSGFPFVHKPSIRPPSGLHPPWMDVSQVGRLGVHTMTGRVPAAPSTRTTTSMRSWTDGTPSKRSRRRGAVSSRLTICHQVRSASGQDGTTSKLSTTTIARPTSTLLVPAPVRHGEPPIHQNQIQSIHLNPIHPFPRPSSHRPRQLLLLASSWRNS